MENLKFRIFVSRVKNVSVTFFFYCRLKPAETDLAIDKNFKWQVGMCGASDFIQVVLTANFK